MALKPLLAAIFVLLLQPVSASAIDGDCVNSGCHTNYGKAKKNHEALDNCGDCHKLNAGVVAASHGKSKVPKKDFALLKSVPDLCWECHDNDAEKTDSLHSPYEDGDCLSCHDVHQSNNPGMLKMAVKETCLDCHDDISEQLDKARFEHDPIDGDETSCTTCHHPHGGDANKFLRKPTVMAMCNECHDELIEPMSEAPQDHLHGPIQKGECQKCHNPHGSPYLALLRGNYPMGMYAPFSETNFKGCFGKCHDAKMFTEKGETKFRNDDQNLHFLHVNRAKGRSCRFCHEPHVSVNEHLIKTSVPFGSWSFGLGWKLQADGAAGCSPGCHAEKKYNKKAK